MNCVMLLILNFRELCSGLRQTDFLLIFKKFDFWQLCKIKKLKKFEIISDNTKISRTATAETLEVVIDGNLSWKHHIKYRKIKIAKNVGISKRLKYRLPENTLNTLCNTLSL